MVLLLRVPLAIFKTADLFCLRQEVK